MKASRAINTTYTNTTGKPIMVCVTLQAVSLGFGYATITANGNGACSDGTQDTLAHLYNVTIIVPPGDSYIVQLFSATLTAIYSWCELR
jgi:hypothetical protein